MQTSYKIALVQSFFRPTQVLLLVIMLKEVPTLRVPRCFHHLSTFTVHLCVWLHKPQAVYTLFL